jgi:hypothetical protein
MGTMTNRLTLWWLRPIWAALVAAVVIAICYLRYAQ